MIMLKINYLSFKFLDNFLGKNMFFSITPIISAWGDRLARMDFVVLDELGYLPSALSFLLQLSFKCVQRVLQDFAEYHAFLF